MAPLWHIRSTSITSTNMHVLEHEPCDTWTQLRWLLNGKWVGNAGQRDDSSPGEIGAGW